jgi:bleomycin hydrolase
MTRRILFTALIVFVYTLSYAKWPSGDGYQFEIIKKLPATSVKDQHKSGTCWSFCTISMMESELLRMNKGKYDLSEMYVVRNAYEAKAKRYVRMHGSINFTGGGATNDVLDVIKTSGMVPEVAYTGLLQGEKKHIHGEMDEVLKEYVDGVLENKNKKLSPAWYEGFEGLLDAYLGKEPGSFEHHGENTNPESYAKSLGLNPDDYVLISSFSHHPFYSKFILEVPDNWSWGMVYNLPLDEMMDVFYTSIERGYTMSWASDVSERGFSWYNGIAIVPDAQQPDLEGTEKEKWEKLTQEEKEAAVHRFDKPVNEKSITQELRQQAFDNFETTDDHGMHIIGTAKDQQGTDYFIVKNSWGDNNKYNGYLYASEAYVKYKTISVLVNKDAIPDNIRRKLEL